MALEVQIGVNVLVWNPTLPTLGSPAGMSSFIFVSAVAISSSLGPVFPVMSLPNELLSEKL